MLVLGCYLLRSGLRKCSILSVCRIALCSSRLSYRIDRRAGQQGSRPSVRGQAEVEKYVTGHHYSEVTSSGWLKSKRHRTRTNNQTSYYHHISIGSINTRTMKESIKLAQCISQCKFLKHDITFIQETHRVEHNTSVFDKDDKELDGWTFINSGMKMKASAGVGIALSTNVRIIDVENILEGRILLVRLTLFGVKLSAFCVYAPTEEYADSTKQLFFNTLLQHSSESCTKHEKEPSKF